MLHDLHSPNSPPSLSSGMSNQSYTEIWFDSCILLHFLLWNLGECHWHPSLVFSHLIKDCFTSYWRDFWTTSCWEDRRDGITRSTLVCSSALVLYNSSKITMELVLDWLSVSGCHKWWPYQPHHINQLWNFRRELGWERCDLFVFLLVSPCRIPGDLELRGNSGVSLSNPLV